MVSTDEVTRVAKTIVDRVAAYFLSLVGAVLLLLAGWIAAQLLRALTGRVPVLLDRAVDRLLGARLVAARAAQVTILVAAILVEADQIGIRITSLAIFIGIAAGAIAGGVIVAISLGARIHVAT